MNAYTGIYSYYCAPLLTREAKSICTQEPCMSAFWHKNIPCKPVRFPQAIEPFWGDIVVGVECIFCWYWLADVCEQENIDFVLGHALYMKSIHGVKTKNDRIDSLKIARLIRGGNFQYNLDTMDMVEFTQTTGDLCCPFPETCNNWMAMLSPSLLFDCPVQGNASRMLSGGCRDRNLTILVV